MDVKLHNKLFRLISFSILFFLTSQVWAQVSTLDVIGVVEQDMVAVENAKITLSKDGKVIQTEYTNRKGEFRFQMDINSEYLVEISKQGLLTKKIAFNTEIPSDVVGKWTMEFAMSLFPGCEGANTSALDSPVDRVKYSSNQGDFISDEAYVRNMRGRIEKMMIDIENCQVETYQEAMEEANKLLQQGDYEAARQKYKEALEVYPDDRTAQRKLADIYKKIGEEKQDEQIFREAVAEADRLYDQKEYAAAKQLYTEALQRKPDPHAQSRLNEIDRLISTQQQASQAAAETERNYTNLIAQANAAYARKDYDAAKQFYQQAMTVKPDASLPRQKVDEISSLIAQQQQQNQQQEALDKSFNEAMAMGQSALQAKDYEAAKRHFNRAQMMKPNEALPRQKIGEIDKAVVDEKRANEMAQQAAQQQRLDQALAEADRMMAQEDYDGALTAYQNALQLNPNDPYLKQQMKKAESAKQGAALEKQNALEKAYQNDISKGDELMASGAYDQAMEAYKQAMMKKPNDAQANSKIQAAQSRQLAAQQQQTLEKNKQRQYEQYLADGNRLFDAKQYPQSKQAYEQALSLYPTQPAPRNRISEIDRILTAQQQEEQYRQTVVKADGLFATKDYTAARTAYQEAQSLKANDPYPVQKINEIDRIIRENSRLQEEQRQLEAQYQQTIQDADRLLAQSRLPESKNAYQKALSYKPGETYPRQQITKIENQLTEQQRLVDQKKAEEEKYASLITDANRLFDAKDYGQAKAAYQQALAMKSAEAFPRQRLAEIDRIMQEQQRQAAQQQQIDQQFAQAVREADNLFNASRLPEARQAYQKALSIKGGEAYPQQQISKIDGLILAEQQRIENEKRAQEQQYVNIINNANRLFDAKDYGQAKAAYQQALAMKSAEAFPRQRLAEIDRIMQEQQRQAAQQQQIDQQYAQAVRDADNLFNASRLPEAKLAYQKASNIKLSETYPQQQIAKIDKVLGEQLRREQEQQALEQQYTNAVAQGDRAFSADQLTDARAAYQEALRIKSAEAYPKAQLAKIDQKLALAEKERQEKAAFEQKYTSMIASADRAYNSRDYKSAKDAYMAALDMKPGERYPQQQLNKIADFERILAAEQANAKVTAVNTGSSSGSQNTKPNPGALSDLKFANDSERDKYLNNLKGQYPEGVTLEVHKGRTATTYRYVVIRGNEVSEFRKVKYNYGDVEYSDNGIPTTGQYFESQVRTRAGEFYQEFNY